MNTWSLPVTVEVAERPSYKVKAPIVGAELAEVVCTVAVFVAVEPICVEPLYVNKANVPVKDFTEAIAVRSVVRCAAVSVMVLVAVPFAHDRPVISK